VTFKRNAFERAEKLEVVFSWNAAESLKVFSW